MAQITLNIPDGKEQRFLNAFATIFGWSNDLGITRRQFMKLKLRDYMKEILFRAESSEAVRQAQQTLQTDIDSITVD